MVRRTGTSNLTNAETIAINAGKGDGYVVITPLAAFDQIVDAVLKDPLYLRVILALYYFFQNEL